MSRSLLITNFVLFQIGWFACVLGGANQLALAGGLVASAVIALHLWNAKAPRLEGGVILTALLIGIVFESLLTLTGLASYPSGTVVEGLAPYWMVLMWGLFATTMNISMRWIKDLPLYVVSFLGIILAPLSYLAGQRLGAVIFSDTAIALMVIALGWAILLPLLVYVARNNDGYAETQSAEPDDEVYANV